MLPQKGKPAELEVSRAGRKNPCFNWRMQITDVDHTETCENYIVSLLAGFKYKNDAHLARNSSPEMGAPL